VFANRQLAGVLFKQYIEVHWSQNSEKYQEPEVEAVVKQRVKQLLPLGLSDESSKIRTTVAHSTAKIAGWDWSDWPELFDLLLSALNGNKIGAPSPSPFNLDSVHGALETLVELLPDMTDLQMPHVVPAIMPQLFKIFIDPQNYSIKLRTTAVEIFTSLVNVVADMAEYDATVGKKYLNPYLPDFTFAMIKALSLPAQESTNVVDNGLKKEIIKVLPH
jgi:hypothetical protein